MEQKQMENLRDNLIDLIAEEQAKLGFREEEVRLYYPLSSLCHLLRVPADTGAGIMQDMLEEFAEEAEETFGRIGISHRGERFCFRLPPEASRYVHERKEADSFIYELVGLVARGGTTMGEILDLFERQPDACEVIPVHDGEVDVMIRFIDAKDRYYYCFKDEGFTSSTTAFFRKIFMICIRREPLPGKQTRAAVQKKRKS